MTPTREDYRRAFETECTHHYPDVAAFEAVCGYAIGEKLLRGAAETLACPVKANPPNWQHGRVIYAALRAYLRNRKPDDFVLCLDIGTAKGFSALMAAYALEHAGQVGVVASVDIVDPAARVSRNTVADLAEGGPRTVPELLKPFPEASRIQLYGGGSAKLFATAQPGGRINFAYVDGKHTYGAVAFEMDALAHHQQPGDLVVIDDMQIDPVAAAVEGRCALGAYWLLAIVAAIPGKREYAIVVRA